MKTNILLIGMPGSGKSSIGRSLAKTLNMKFIDMDIHIQKTSGKTINELFSISEENFRDEETRSAKELAVVENTVIASGGGVVVRKENVDALKDSCTIIYINRSIKKILDSKNISKRPLLSEDKTRIYELFNERKELYEKYSDFKVNNNGYFKRCVDDIVKILNKNK